MFTNSDVNMLLLFLRFLKKFFHLTDDDISLTCHFYINDGVSFEEVEKYWDEKLGLPKFCFRKTTVNKLPRKSNTKRKLTTRYGVCKIIVNKVEVLQSIYGGIQEFAGFTNNDWVTGKW